METLRTQRIIRTDIRTSLTPSFAFPYLQIRYPEVLVKALVAIYLAYNEAFRPLVDGNREWTTDYRYSLLTGSPINWAVQIDMVGLTNEELEHVGEMNLRDAIVFMTPRIFEIENSLALYQLLDRICDRDGVRSFPARKFRELLDSIRQRFGMPIALLAVTHGKYAAMMETEFGKKPGDTITNEEVRELSGFDAFFGRGELANHLALNHADCNYLLYARTSDPVEKLRKPDTHVFHPLLCDPGMRQLIRMNAITFNIDDPAWEIGDSRRINDTKAYLPALGMGLRVNSDAELQQILGKSGNTMLRAKPMQGTYGCYGHERGLPGEEDFRRKVRRGLRDRGPYILQPERTAPVVLNEADGIVYNYIDRVFVGMMDKPEFLGGFREFLPADSQEAKAGRLHGNRETVFAEIAPQGVM